MPTGQPGCCGRDELALDLADQLFDQRRLGAEMVVGDPAAVAGSLAHRGKVTAIKPHSAISTAAACSNK
jgi:hypothetical protein